MKQIFSVSYYSKPLPAHIQFRVWLYVAAAFFGVAAFDAWVSFEGINSEFPVASLARWLRVPVILVLCGLFSVGLAFFMRWLGRSAPQMFEHSGMRDVASIDIEKRE